MSSYVIDSVWVGGKEGAIDRIEVDRGDVAHATVAGIAAGLVTCLEMPDCADSSVHAHASVVDQQIEAFLFEQLHHDFLPVSAGEVGPDVTVLGAQLLRPWVGSAKQGELNHRLLRRS